MSEVRISAESRTEFGKGAARRVRRDDKVPAVLYGHGQSPRHIALPGHELMLALKTPNVLLSLDLGGERQLALPKDVQRDPVKGFLEHVDLIIVNRGEKVTIDLPVTVTGDVAGDGLLVIDHQVLSVETEATHIPDSVEVSVEGLEVGAQVHAGDIALPPGVTLQDDPEVLVLAVSAPRSTAQLEAELAESETEAGIVHEQSSADAEAVAQAEASGTGSAGEGSSAGARA